MYDNRAVYLSRLEELPLRRVLGDNFVPPKPSGDVAHKTSPMSVKEFSHAERLAIRKRVRLEKIRKVSNKKIDPKMIFDSLGKSGQLFLDNASSITCTTNLADYFICMQKGELKTGCILFQIS